ncbi:phosphoribosylamine--glycine ligase [Flavipsychrobacter stenotrophus]|uniref:Phosphoribosylamine--glycine ligase n=1 Tax=Flavipsychrobacter stenotrophus TaxID=2077091 RepID=A0A2S7T1F5_9BACT|nr:phosphoribosylamine--glycine ligase [Flavipsychrobacter stenotrophus]PQJ13039.1 phosphoribosylamine--glycine ligase [Flavipsychrobacter stenotrophus]
MKNILLLGGGGRECTLAWKIRQSPLCGDFYIAPGNAGTSEYGTNLPVGVTDFEAIKKICTEKSIDIVMVGPEDPLVAGIYDFFKNDDSLKHIVVVGPSKDGAQLEGSKAFSKKFMERHNIPTAAYREFTKDSFEEGVAYIRQAQPPIVLKADGLAAGKGVVITSDIEEAVDAFKAMVMDAQFGKSSEKVVIEQFLDGIELSVFALCDGDNYVLLPEAKDYKRIGEGDTGLNTGGMGAISPVPFADKTFMDKVIARVVEPTVRGLKAENIVYKGFVFFGLIKVGGEPYVIEYNCRMGDPETEVVIPRLKNDIIDLFLKMAEGKLSEVTIEHDSRAAGAVMMVAGGYPGDYAKGKVMTGFDKVQGSMFFHAGTTTKDGDVVTNGGRVLAITSYGSDIKAALAKSYENAALLQYEDKYYRKDIGWEF